MLLSLLLFAVLTSLVLIAPMDTLTKLVGNSYSIVLPSVVTVSSTLGGDICRSVFFNRSNTSTGDRQCRNRCFVQRSVTVLRLVPIWWYLHGSLK